MFKSLKFKKSTAWLMTLFMVFSFFTPLNVSAAENETVTIQLLATSDTHGCFYPYNYATLKENKNGSLAQIATIIKELKSTNPNTVIVDAGDTIQGNASYMFFDESIHPMMLAMNEIGYDTWTLGNHEFNYGIPTLEKIISQSKAKVLCGNVYKKAEGKRLASPYTIVEKGGVKIGVIGMTAPNIVNWDASKIADTVSVTSPIEETKKAVEEIKGKVDVIVGVMHVGEDGEFKDTPVFGDDSAQKITKAIPEISVFVGAHAHKATNSVVNGTTFVENNSDAASLQKVDIKLTKKDGKYVVENKATDIKSEIKNAKDFAPDADLMKKLESYHKKAMTLDSVIAEVKGGDLVPPTEIKGITQSQIQDTALVDLINTVQMYYGKTDISAAAVLDTKANVVQGPFKKADLDLVYKYDNNLLTIAKLNGAQLKKYMEWSASYYNTYKPGDLTVSFNPDVRSYNYDMFSGLKYEIDISKPVGQRIVNLRKMDNTPIKDTDTFKIALNDYRGFNTLKTTVLKGENIELEATSYVIKNLIEKYIVEVKKGILTPECDNNWKVIGNNWDAQKRAQAVKLVNEGKISIHKSADGRTPNVASVTESDIQKAASKKIDIVSFNDFHGSLLEETNGKNPGAAKLATVISNAKKANPNTIVVSGGDIYQGSAMSNTLYGKPVTDMVKALGLQASAVGNHEFDWGINRVTDWAKEGNFDFLAANVYEKGTNKPASWAKPYKIVEKDGIKVAFIGLTTPDTKTQTKAEYVENVDFRDPVESAKEWVGYLKSGKAPEGKPDIIVALTHIASYQDSKTKAITGEAIELTKVDGLDAVISAHSHQAVSGMVNNKPLVQAYYNGRDLAKVTLYVDGSGKVFASEASLDEFYKAKDKITPDPEVKAVMDKYEVQLKPMLDEVVGTTDKELPHDRSKGPSLLGEWVCEVMAKTAGTQIGITNGGGLRCPIPQGNITVGKLYELMPFDNTLVKMELKGSDLKRVIENGIANDKVGWVQISGVKVYYDTKLPFGNRITSMRLMDGTLVDMDKYYSVVVNDFMYNPADPAKGGDGFNFAGARNASNTQVPIRDALIKELKAVKNLSLVKSNYLEEGADSAGTAQVSTVVSKQAFAKLPKTGSIVDTNVLVDLGAVICALGIAMFVMTEDKKKKNNAA